MTYIFSPASHRAIACSVIVAAGSVIFGACHSTLPETGLGGDPPGEILVPGSSLLVPPRLGDSAIQLVVLRRGPGDTAPQRMAAVRREQHIVSGQAGQVLLTSTWSPPPNVSVDSLVVEREGLAPVQEHLDYRGTYRYQYSRNHVLGTLQRQDSAARAFDQTFPHNVFAFGEVDLLARSLPFRRGLRVIVPLFSESDADLEMDTLTVLGPDSTGAPAGNWVVRFADPVIIQQYVVHAASREIVATEITQKRSGTKLRFVTPSAAGT